MAQHRADNPKRGPHAGHGGHSAGDGGNNPDPPTLPGKVLLPPVEPPPPESSSSDVASIDKLLAMTDDVWSVDDDVRALQNASDDGASAVEPLRDHAPEVLMPTAFELAPNATSGPSIPPAAGGTKPPPLPIRASQAPGARKGPPPLPGSIPPPPVPGTTPPSLPPPLPRVPDTGRQRRSLTSEAPRASGSAEGSGSRRSMATPPEVGAAGLVDLLHARIAALSEPNPETKVVDKVGLARAHIEMAIACEAQLGDDARAIAHAEAALRIDGRLAAAHAILRRKRHGRAALSAMLEHLEHELTASTEEVATVELLVEKARLLDAAGEDAALVRATWEKALSRAPEHPAALKGLEADLVARAYGAPHGARPSPAEAAEAFDALAKHLGRMAEAYHDDPRLAAWLHVERAQILELRLRRVDEARGALERAVELDPSVGPVRNACVRHVAAQSDAGALAALLEEEAHIETDPHRAARLELDAACISSELLHDPARAIDLLTRAARRAPTSAAVDRKVLDELVRLHENQAQWAEAARARRARLRFVTEPKSLAYELRLLARIGERTDELEAAISDVQRALHVDPEDATMLDMLDRLLAAVQRDEQRVDMWLDEAKRLEDGTRRARALTRAAQIAETALMRPADAIRHLRGAWVAAPGDAEVLDALARLMTPAPPEELDREARALVDLYAQAAAATRDAGRKVAYLEKAAVLWEEVIGDARRAARAYEEILQLEPDRRGAVIGLGRTASRVGDDRALARALLDEARLAEDGVDILTLRVRAATALGRVDPDRALVLVEEVLEQDAAHPTARALETRLHEEAARWERACQSLVARIEHATAPKEQVSLWLALAQIQDLHLRNPKEALTSLQAARKLDPSHPVPPGEILRMLEASGDAVTLRDALEALAKDAETPEERLRFLIRAAEIDEFRLSDDDRAALTYARAMAEAEDEEIVAERLERVLARRAAKLRSEGTSFGMDELLALQQQRVERAETPSAQRHLSFDVAQLLVEAGRDHGTATALLDSVLLEDEGHVPSLRLLELVTRRAGDWSALGQTLSRQGDALRDKRARLGALWTLAGLEEWRLPVGDAAPTYGRILDLDPTEPSALEATVRRELPHTRRGEPRARKAVIGALRSLFALASENGTRLAIQLRLALLLEESASEAGEATAASLVREALDRYRACLHIDDLSVTAATGLARTSTRLRDTEGAIAASTALAELAAHPKARAQYLANAADLLLSATSDERLGSGMDRRARASLLLERALDADPDSVPTAARLAQVRKEDGLAERLVEPFRTAIAKARAVDAVIMLGGEIARVARDELQDLPLGIEALRRVRSVAPLHVPSLLMLGELCVAQRAWPEAVDALEAVVSSGREATPRMTALFTLANLYEHVLNRLDDAERSLRLALGIEPENPRALRGLLRHITTVRTPGEVELTTKERLEVADLLSRLAAVERDPAQRCELLLELAEMRGRLADPAGVEQALIEAVAQTPQNKKAFTRLASLFRKPGPSSARDHAGYATALGKVVARGRELGRVDSKWLATLGEIEIESLNRLRDGIAHLQQAVQLDPGLHETRLELARAYARSGAPEDTSRQLFTLFTVPQSSPNEPAATTPLMSLKEPTAALVLFEQALGAERRNEEALVVSELRAIAGDLDEGRLTWLRQRRLGPIEPHHAQLDRPALVTHVLPPEGRHVLLEVAAAVAGIESKILRADLTEIGVTSRDRVGARSGHPTRALLDRLMRVLGLTDVELVIAPTVTRTRVLAQDTLWVVVPRTLCDLPEPSQLASLGRALTRISLGVPWLEELPPPHIEALLIACARQVVHGYGADELDVLSSKLVAQYEPNVARALTRKHKKLLEELTPHIGAPQGRPIPVDGFISALARAELRAAAILTGDLLATLDDVRGMDAILFHATERPGVTALGAVLNHAYAGDVCRYAMSAEAVAMRRRIGTTWTA